MVQSKLNLLLGDLEGGGGLSLGMGGGGGG